MAHAAISYIKVGRGWGTIQHPVIKCGTVGKAGKTWHILDPNYAICGTLGAITRIEEEVNCHTIRLLGRPVCARCRRLLGTVPPAEYTGPQRNKGKKMVKA